MNDQVQPQSETPAPNQTPAPETKPLANDPAARTTTGELKDAAQLAAETKPEDKKPDAKPAEGKKDGDPKKDDAAKGPPEKYEDFKVPEGFNLAPEAVSKAGEVFKGLGLTQDQAQSLIDFHTNELKRVTDSATQTYEATRKEWRDEVLKDTSLAANGELRPDVKATMSKAIDTLGPELSGKFREALNLTGIGDNPAFVKGFAQLAQKFAEGTSVTGSGPSAHGQSKSGQGTKPTAAQALFPGLPSSAG